MTHLQKKLLRIPKELEAIKEWPLETAVYEVIEALNRPVRLPDNPRNPSK